MRICRLFTIMLLLFNCYQSIAQNAGAQNAGAQNPVIAASKLFGRKYKIGDTYRYKLTMEELHNGKLDHISISICELKVVKDSLGCPYDEVHWVSRITITGKDTVDATKTILPAKPYLISLDPKGKVDLPKIEFPALTEPIQDFNTFFIAVSPLTGATKLNKKDDTTSIQQPVKADFSNGSTILKGEDCIDISVRITDITKKLVMLTTSFAPPTQQCLSFLTPDMNTPVVNDTINNFQMVMEQGPGKYLVQYGREFFYINSMVQKSDGKITNAAMYNILNLNLKINCDKEYKNCQFEMPFSEQRNLRLELQ
jgi:hypothetical protein